jgi:hypothetical protein
MHPKTPVESNHLDFIPQGRPKAGGQFNIRSRRVRLSDISLKVIWEKQLNKHLLSPPQAELEALASPIPRSGPLSSLRYGVKV